MGSLQHQLFVQAASQSLKHLAEEYQKRFETKKGDRFSVDGITYEIGPPKYVDDFISFEISSKIPEEEFPNDYDQTKYFEQIKKICDKAEKRPSFSGMENIVRETIDNERKERGYVKLTFQYSADELYDEQDIIQELQEFSKHPEKKKPPRVPGVNTLASRIILNQIQEALFESAEKNIRNLIHANRMVCSEFKVKKPGKKSKTIPKP